MGEKINACRIFGGEPEGNRPLGRRRRKWVDNIKINLREIQLDDMGLDSDRLRALVNTVMSLRDP
jgi:hypothetical protein